MQKSVFALWLESSACRWRWTEPWAMSGTRRESASVATWNGYSTRPSSACNQARFRNQISVSGCLWLVRRGFGRGRLVRRIRGWAAVDRRRSLVLVGRCDPSGRTASGCWAPSAANDAHSRCVASRRCGRSSETCCSWGRRGRANCEPCSGRWEERATWRAFVTERRRRLMTSSLSLLVTRIVLIVSNCSQIADTGRHQAVNIS